MLLSVYLLFIQHYVFKGRIDRNDLNLGYGRGGGVGANLDIFWLERFHCSFIMELLFLIRDDSFGGEKESEVGIQSTSFVKILWQFKGHLLFGCSGVCVIA